MGKHARKAKSQSPLKERKKRERERKLDRELESTFPASDSTAKY